MKLLKGRYIINLISCQNHLGEVKNNLTAYSVYKKHFVFLEDTVC